LTLGIPAVWFVSLGTRLSNFVNSTFLAFLLGVFLIVLRLAFLIFQKLVVPPTSKIAILGGSLSGLSAGILGTGGAIRDITLSAFNLGKNKFIATSAIMDLDVTDIWNCVMGSPYRNADLDFLLPDFLNHKARTSIINGAVIVHGMAKSNSVSEKKG
jgi:hypothetical protein